MAFSSHGALYTGEWEYDVFLCFRGDDTRHCFASHLMAALAASQIQAFNDAMLHKTQSFDELLSVLQRSALSIVIFSEKFADSPWCLNEVATVAQSMANFGHRALPVFYKVGWSDVVADSGSYSTTIVDKLKASSEDNKRWKDALKAIANCAGHTSEETKIESELIKLIVEDVQKQLIDMSPSIKSNNLVGIGPRVLEVQRLLAMEELDDTRIIGLWGMGGLGKTALAKACYDRTVSSKKEIKHHFIRNINESCESQVGVEGIVQDLYSKLLSEKNLSREDLDMKCRRARLSRSKVFIVLDNVETPCQLEQLLLGDVSKHNKLFAMGSRIIVTTRNKKVLQNAMARVYAMKALSYNESIRLFSLHAFRQYYPPDDWMHLSHLAASYCKGNSLALRVLGGTLFGEDIQYWQNFLSGLRRIQKPEIHDILRRSYNKLGVQERRLFLDVACLLNGIARSRLIKYMAVTCSSTYCIVKDLIDKSLLICISCKDGEKIEVHDLLKEMAWNIVNEEQKLRKRTRLVDPEDIHKLLTTHKMVLPTRKRRKVIHMHGEGNCTLEKLRTTEGISLDLSKAKEMHLEANAFEGMDSLTFLNFWLPINAMSNRSARDNKFLLPYGGLDSLPGGLRWLHWDQYPSKSLPLRFYPQHLVHLIIRDSPIKRLWQGFDQPLLVNLMVLNLSYCASLLVIPDLSKSSKLEELLLRECKSLVEVPSQVRYLDRLIAIDLGYCVNLKHLPSKFNSKFLKNVWMDHCPNVKHCPDMNSGELMELDLNETPVIEPPEAIYHVKQGGILRLCGKHFANFPAISARLQEFHLCHSAIKDINPYGHHQASSELLPEFGWLELVGNLQCKSLPKNIWNMVSSLLTIRHSPLLENLPEISEPVSGLSYLSIIRCESIKSIPSSINNLVSLSYLGLRNTGIKSLPSSIQELDQLNSIDLSYCKSLEHIPSNIQKLPKLYGLYLRGCRSISSLPELPSNLSILDVGGCKSLQALPSNASKLSWESLRFYNCPELDRTFPDEIVANYPVYATLPRRCKAELQYLGSDIPEWFSSKSANGNDGSSVMVHLPPSNGSSERPMLKGIAFGVVWFSDSFCVWPTMKCDCSIGTITVASWSSCHFSLDGDGTNSSDKVFLWFDQNLSGKSKEREGKGEEEAWYVKYAGLAVSFRFYPRLGYGEDVKQLENFKIKRCGVSLMY
ncbi:unnamed protein product [Linum tenue]|uniref:TIR domain-containing protein n=1 Tax=Linum tenue TaxID=586396 RepID=A0AAV0RFX1_9ROSI|nr:unnamed protein product [Linum tenue]